MNVVISLILLLSINSAFAQQQASTGTPLNLQPEGIALNGYDAVSYHLGSPSPGKAAYTYRFEGATYLFAEKKNLETFAANPHAYIPAYGGWCAYAMGESGNLVEINPKAYKIIDGTLYLFYKTDLVNTLKRWNNNEEQLKKAADANWAKRKN
ncbi:MAG: YHS domain protein [Bacteroidetes bacterium]|nr:YHS domain protein [Bacteroidota bacterium]